MDLLYPAIEPNYGTPASEDWRETSANWPGDPQRAVAALACLVALRREGLHVANDETGLGAMQDHCRDPAARQAEVMRHSRQIV